MYLLSKTNSLLLHKSYKRRTYCRACEAVYAFYEDFCTRLSKLVWNILETIMKCIYEFPYRGLMIKHMKNHPFVFFKMDSLPGRLFGNKIMNCHFDLLGVLFVRSMDDDHSTYLEGIHFLSKEELETRIILL